MKLHSFDKVKQLTEDMVAIPSINKEPGGESAVARYMQDFYMSLPYFQAHPEQVKCFQTKNDFVVRHSTLASCEGTKGNSNRTVILIGHIDTVGVDDFGTIREYAFRCEDCPPSCARHSCCLRRSLTTSSPASICLAAARWT